MPRPARRIGTMATFLPESSMQVHRSSGVSTTTSSSGKSRVAS